MARAKTSDIMTYGALAAGGFAAYKFIYLPWKASQTPPATSMTDTTFPPPVSYKPPSTPSYGPYITTPTVLTPQPIQPSNLNPGAVVGGATGTCMTRKGWPQAQCQQRLDGLRSAYEASIAALARLKSGAELNEINRLITANQAALQNAGARYNQDLANGDNAGAAKWKTAIDGHIADINSLEAAKGRIATMIAGYENAAAGHRSDYLALTGLSL